MRESNANRNKNNRKTVCVHELKAGEMLDSMLTRSTTVGILMACPHDDRAPLMDWIVSHTVRFSQNYSALHTA